jgi:prophage regulatory protein
MRFVAVKTVNPEVPGGSRRGHTQRPRCVSNCRRDGNWLKTIAARYSLRSYSRLVDDAIGEPDMQTRPQPASALHIDASAAIFLRIGVVVRLTGLGRSTIYRLMAAEQFPPPVRLAKRVVAWRRTDLERWSDTRIRASH